MNYQNPPQSAWAAIVDIAILGTIIVFALSKVVEPVAWTLLGSIVSGRFGVSLGKTIERARMSGGGGDDGGGSSGRYQAVKPQPTQPLAGSAASTQPIADPAASTKRLILQAITCDFPTLRSATSLLVLACVVTILAIARAR